MSEISRLLQKALVNLVNYLCRHYLAQQKENHIKKIREESLRLRNQHSPEYQEGRALATKLIEHHQKTKRISSGGGAGGAGRVVTIKVDDDLPEDIL